MDIDSARTYFQNPKRILVKLSGEALQGSKGYGIDSAFLEKLVWDILVLRQREIELVIVIGGGNIFRGVSDAAKWFTRENADFLWMLATMMNGIAFADALGAQWCPVQIFSALEVEHMLDPFVRTHALESLSSGRVVITVGGIGHAYYTTDSTAVLRALELDCDYAVKATTVDGVYDKDPKKHPDAIRYETITLDETLSRGLRVMDGTAIALAKEEQLPLFVCDIGDIRHIGDSGMRGTYVTVS